jgi:hypothetical protein|uniref:CU044_2847 family protein n=1 Tax=Paractinoplanes polyasparticus TaxID=2856853 RepID=UPI001C849160|nr:CU044_2847 family protein [Actinoplanes polyasparticus]
MSEADGSTRVKVVELRSGREIGWGDGLTERLGERVSDVRQAVSDGVSAIAASIKDLPAVGGWEPDEVSATFGIALVAEAGVVLSKASAEATFEVTVTFRRGE